MSTVKKVSENKSKNAGVSAADNAYMRSKPNRLEVANYVNSLMEQHYMPLITNYIQMSSMALQAILLRKGICTGDEIRDITEEFVKENQRRAKESQAIQEIRKPERKEMHDSMEGGLVARIESMLSIIGSEDWEKEDLSADERKSLYVTLNGAYLSLVNININSSDVELMEHINKELPSLTKEVSNLISAIDDNTIFIKNTETKENLRMLLEDTLKRLEKGGVQNDPQESQDKGE